MDDVDVTLPTFERVTLALGFQPLVSKDVFHEPVRFTVKLIFRQSYCKKTKNKKKKKNKKKTKKKNTKYLCYVY